MAVYVDPLAMNGWKFYGKFIKNSHLFADTRAELHQFASKLGLKRAWFQEGSIPHYDITSRKRTAAIKAGAVELDRRASVETWRRIRKTIAPRQQGGIDGKTRT